MTNLPHRLRIMAILVLLAGYILLNHHLAQQKQASNLATLVACLPLLLAGTSLAWQQRTFWVRAILLTSLVTLPVIGWPLLKSHPANIYMTQHVALFGGLAIWFGRSLVGDRQALCTQFARFDQPVMTDAILRYTRRVTLAWTVFFVVMASTSVGLFLWSSVSVWSLFANFFSLPLVILMFAAEYAVRCRVLPEGRTGITSAFFAYRRAMVSARQKPSP